MHHTYDVSETEWNVLNALQGLGPYTVQVDG